MLASVKSIYLRLPYFNKSFLILSSGRSGSTLLVQYLNYHPSIQCHGELLNREDLEGSHLGRGTDSQTLTNYILAKLVPFKPWLPYTGFKLFNEQLEYCDISLKTILDSLQAPPIIILYRENLLETFVSLKIAQYNDIWFSESIVNSCSVEVDWDDLLEYCERERRRWRGSLKAVPASCKMTFVSFEEMIENQNQVACKLFRFLGVGDLCVFATSKRQNPQPLERKVSNYTYILSRAKSGGVSLTLTKEWIQNCLSEE